MKHITAAVAAVTLAAMTLVSTAPQAEARGWGGGFVAAAIIGGVAAAVIASRYRHRHYGYGYGYYGSPVYYRPAYVYGGFYPRWHHHRHWRRW